MPTLKSKLAIPPLHWGSGASLSLPPAPLGREAIISCMYTASWESCSFSSHMDADAAPDSTISRKVPLPRLSNRLGFHAGQTAEPVSCIAAIHGYFMILFATRFYKDGKVM